MSETPRPLLLYRRLMFLASRAGVESCALDLMLGEL
jgi:hypothetical protein